jgi:flagellar motor switch protein FliN/FliY
MIAPFGIFERYGDLQLDIEAELARTTLTLRQILALDSDSIIELPQTASERINVMVGGAPVARGAIVPVAGTIAVRIGELREEA